MDYSGARKAIRTYSRQRKPSFYDEEPPAKRRRVASTERSQTDENDNQEDVQPIPPSTSHSSARGSSALLSSPKDAAGIFSDDAPRSSPPSSPIPRTSTPPTRKRRPMFSFVKRQSKPELPVQKPLSELSQNISDPPRQAPRKKKMVQMRLDLVAEPNKTCKVCGMEYVPSLAEDAALHRKFHATNMGGVDISKAISERLRQNQVWSGGEGSFIAVVSRRDALGLRNKAREALKVVNTELGAVSISDGALWSQTRNPILPGYEGYEEKAQDAGKGCIGYSSSDRYKVYMYMQGGKCVGVCLAERIQEGFSVLEGSGNSSSISISETRTRAILGISRIWTSSSHRKQGVATTLLNSARLHFLYGLRVGKDQVAFSQPTESGQQLARNWFGRPAGWLVYID